MPTSRPAPRASSGSRRRSGAARRSGCAGSTTVSELAPERLRPAPAWRLRRAVPLLHRDQLDAGRAPRRRPPARSRRRRGAPDRRPRPVGPPLGGRAAANLLFSVLLGPPADAPAPALARRRARGRRGARARGHGPGAREVAERCARRRRQGGGDPARGSGQPGRLRDRDQRQSGRRGVPADTALPGDLAPGRRRAPVRSGRRSRRGAGRARGRCGQWLDAGLEGLIEELEARNALRGRRVLVEGSRDGTADAIAPDGRLTVVLDDGETMLVGSGEVELG